MCDALSVWNISELRKLQFCPHLKFDLEMTQGHFGNYSRIYMYNSCHTHQTSLSLVLTSFSCAITFSTSFLTFHSPKVPSQASQPLFSGVASSLQQLIFTGAPWVAVSFQVFSLFLHIFGTLERLE